MHKINLVKTSIKRLTTNKIREQIANVRERTLSSNRSDRWNLQINNFNWVPKQTADGFTYFVEFIFQEKGDYQGNIDKIVHIVASVAKRFKWEILSIDGKNIEQTTQNAQYADIEIINDYESCFSHIYEREDQISLIVDSIKSAITSNWKNKFHCALVGESASGKTEILFSIKNMLDEKSVIHYNVAKPHNVIINEINEREEHPRIILIDQCENISECGLRWLLDITDYRNNVQVLCIATVNNYEMLTGSLASNFVQHIYCPQPDKNLIKKILKRQIEASKDGNMSWIEPTLIFCEEFKITDPRRAEFICMVGRDKLLDGSFQAILRRTSVKLMEKK